jgi:hypothetical protein
MKRDDSSEVPLPVLRNETERDVRETETDVLETERYVLETERYVRETERDVRETTYNSDCICNSELSCFVLL